MSTFQFIIEQFSWYPFFFGLAVGISVEYLLIQTSKEHQKHKSTLFFLMLSLIISAWCGAKIFFLYFNHVSFNLWPSYFFSGGLMFHGGLAFGLITLLVWTNFFEMTFQQFLIPRLAIILCIAQAIGRIGCYSEGCCSGRPFLGIIAIQLFEAIGLGFLAILFKLLLEKKINVLNVRKFLVSKSLGPKSWIGSYLVATSMLRLWTEYFREDPRGIFSMRLFSSQINFSLTAVFAFSFLMVGIIFLLLDFNFIFNKKKLFKYLRSLVFFISCFY